MSQQPNNKRETPAPKNFQFAATILALCFLVTGGALAVIFPEHRVWVLVGVMAACAVMLLVLYLIAVSIKQH